MMPAGVARPRHADEVAAVLAWCADEGITLTPRGGGTGMPGGNVSRALVLDLGALTHLEVSDDGRLHAGAGALAADGDRLLRGAGRHLPALPSSAPWCTFGGMVATNAAGARSFSRGSVRRWTEAVDVILADGGRERLGRSTPALPGSPWSRLHSTLTALPLPPPPAVRKNSSGYAVDDFLTSGDPLDLVVGSEGTLAVVTGGTFRSEPVPPAGGVVLVGVGSPDDLPPLTREAERSGATACEYLGYRFLELGGLLGDPRLAPLDVRAGLLLVEYAATTDEVAAGLAGWGGTALRATLPAEVDALWGLRHAASPSIARAAGERRSLQFIEDAVVPRDRLGEYLRAVESILADHRIDGVIFGHAGDGHLHVNPLIDLRAPRWRAAVRTVFDEVTDVVASLGGTLSGEHGDGRIRAGTMAQIWSAPHRHAFGVVKAALDPGGRLNPGVVLPEPGADPLDGFAEGPDLQRLEIATPPVDD